MAPPHSQSGLAVPSLLVLPSVRRRTTGSIAGLRIARRIKSQAIKNKKLSDYSVSHFIHASCSLYVLLKTIRIH